MSNNNIDNINSIISLNNPINVTTTSVNNGTSDYNWETYIGATGNKNQIGPGLINMSDYTNICSIIASPQYGINVINTPDPNNTPVSLGTGIVTEGLQMSNDFDPSGNVINRLLLSPAINVMLLTETINNNNPTFKISDTTKYVSISSTLLEFSNGINIQDLNGSSITSAGGDTTLQTGGTGVLSLNSGDNIQATCGENFFVSTNTTTGTIQFNSPTPTYFNTATANTGDGVISVGEINRNNGDISIISQSNNLNLQSTTGMNLTVNNGALALTSSGAGISLSTDLDINLSPNDLANSGGVKWNSYPMGITFFNKWNGGFTYGTPSNWEMVRQNTFQFPTQFLYGTWAVSFSINCSNVGSSLNDKALAMYFNFIDGNSNTYNGFSYNQSFPYANWFQPSTYTSSTSQTPLSITYTDYFDFSGAVNDLQLQINWYADNPQNQNDFFVSTTFTLMTLI